MKRTKEMRRRIAEKATTPAEPTLGGQEVAGQV